MGNITTLNLFIGEPIKGDMKKKIVEFLEKVRETMLDLSGLGISSTCDKDSIGVDVDWSMNKKEHKIFIDIGKQLYDLSHPIYGYAESEAYFFNEDPPLPDNEETKDIYNLKTKYIYWANFFGPKFVEKIGKDKLLSAPSWKTEELKDGGILLILGPAPCRKVISREEVEKHLGFPYQYLFSLEPKYGQYLRDGNVNKIRAAFKDNNYQLSQHIKISEIDPIDWKIVDGTAVYRVTDVGARLKVYKVSNE